MGTTVEINANGNIVISEEMNKEQNVVKSMTMQKKLRIILAEMIGTGFLVFFGCMGCIDWTGGGLGVSVPLNFGLTVMFIIQIFGHISYALINPAVTIAAVVNKLIDYKMALILIPTQLIGASLGMGLLFALTPTERFVTPEGDHGICTTHPHDDLSMLRAFFVEFFLTTALVLIVCGVWHPKNRENGDSAPLRIGLAVATLSIAGGPKTEAGMNPARSFGPALLSWDWQDHWIYWLAPCTAGLLASLFYRYVFHTEKERKSE